MTPDPFKRLLQIAYFIVFAILSPTGCFQPCDPSSPICESYVEPDVATIVGTWSEVDVSNHPP